MEEIRRRTWDFMLTVTTVLLLGTLGLQSFIGTLYVWWAERSITDWELVGQPAFIDRMNLIAAPQIIALVVVMGLCVPKRLFSRTVLTIVSTGMVGVGAVVSLMTRSVQQGLSVYLLLAATIQVAVVAMTVAGARGPSYLTEGRLSKTGSGLLHLGFVLFVYVVIALQRSAFMLPVFYTSAVLCTVGTLLTFYAEKLAFRRVVRVDDV